MWQAAKKNVKRLAVVGVSAGTVGTGIGYVTMQRIYAVPDENEEPARDAKTAIVIGGGVVGITTARELARCGFQVRVLERQNNAAEGTSIAPAGHIATSAYQASLASPSFVQKLGLSTFFNDPRLDHVDEADDLARNKFVKLTTWLDWNFWAWSLAELSMMRFCKDHEALNDVLGPAMVKEHKEALVKVAKEEGLMKAMDLNVDGGRMSVAYHMYHQSGFGMRKNIPGVERLSAKQVAEREPMFAAAHDDGLIRGGQWAPLDGYGDCQAFTQGLADKLKTKYGVQFDYGTSISKLVVNEDSTMKGIKLINGEMVTADLYVLAAGADTPNLAATAGIHVPITQMRGYKIIAPARKGKAPRSSLVVKPYELYVTPLKDEVHFAGYGEFAPSWDKQPTKELEERLCNTVRLCFPRIDDVVEWDKRHVVFGRRPQTPDSEFVIGPTKIKGLYLNSGHCSYGFRGAVHSAQLLANGLMNGFKTNGVYYRFFTLARFQPVRPQWDPELLDPNNRPSLAELGKDRRKKK